VATVFQQLEEKYETIGKLREGGMGAIYLVRHKLLGEQRVVKILRPQLEGDREFALRFVREAQTLIKVRHSHIAQLYDFYADEAGNAAMVMEFIPGVDLRELLRRHGPPSLGLALEIAFQALSAVGFLHRRNMVHRDISPDNLMLSRDADGKPLVKLIDLGIVKALESTEATGLTSTGMFIGKVRYASPEQFKSSEGVRLDQRSDLYSFGVVLYELLTGRLPVVGDTASALIAAHLYHPPLGFEVTDPQGRVPAELRELVMALLAKEVEARPKNAEEVQARLQQLKGKYPFSLEELAKLLPPMEEAQPTLRASPFPSQPSLQQEPLPTAPTAAAAATVATAPAGPEPSLPPAAPPVAKAAGRRVPLWAAAVLLAGALAAAAFLAWPHLAQWRSKAPAATGALVLHAVPWGEVVSITNGKGESLPLPQPATTPLHLVLPPGTYKVALKDPTTGTITTTQVVLGAGVTTRTVVPLQALDPQEFLQKLGWR
jgi:serine/threonine-protein kinase